MANFCILEADDLSVEARDYYDMLSDGGQEDFLRLADEHEEEAVVAYLDWHGMSGELDEFEELYQGIWDSEVDFAKSIINDCYNLEKMMGGLARYFDYEEFASDLFIDDYTYEDGFVFRNC